MLRAVDRGSPFLFEVIHLNESVTVIGSEYVLSAVNRKQYPVEQLPQIAFIGRSNVGKSSLINSLLHRKNLARTSQTPGKTQTINFYKVDLKINRTPDIERRSFYCVDLPGYGYAKTSKANRAEWSKFIDQYFTENDQLLFTCLLIDIRHPPMTSDLAMFNRLVERGVPVLPVATKADKLSPTAQQNQLETIKQAFNIPELDVLPYSSTKNEGRSDLLDVIANSLLQ